MQLLELNVRPPPSHPSSPKSQPRRANKLIHMKIQCYSIYSRHRSVWPKRKTHIIDHDHILAGDILILVIYWPIFFLLSCWRDRQKWLQENPKPTSQRRTCPFYMDTKKLVSIKHPSTQFNSNIVSIAQTVHNGIVVGSSTENGNRCACVPITQNQSSHHICMHTPSNVYPNSIHTSNKTMYKNISFAISTRYTMSARRVCTATLWLNTQQHTDGERSAPKHNQSLFCPAFCCLLINNKI